MVATVFLLIKKFSFEKKWFNTSRRLQRVIQMNIWRTILIILYFKWLKVIQWWSSFLLILHGKIHNSVYNIIISFLQGLYSLRSWDVRLTHYQFYILFFNSGGINLFVGIFLLNGSSKISCSVDFRHRRNFRRLVKQKFNLAFKTNGFEVAKSVSTFPTFIYECQQAKYILWTFRQQPFELAGSNPQSWPLQKQCMYQMRDSYTHRAS